MLWEMEGKGCRWRKNCLTLCAWQWTNLPNYQMQCRICQRLCRIKHLLSSPSPFNHLSRVCCDGFRGWCQRCWLQRSCGCLQCVWARVGGARQGFSPYINCSWCGKIVSFLSILTTQITNLWSQPTCDVSHKWYAAHCKRHSPLHILVGPGCSGWIWVSCLPCKRQVLHMWPLLLRLPRELSEREGAWGESCDEWTWGSQQQVSWMLMLAVIDMKYKNALLRLISNDSHDSQCFTPPASINTDSLTDWY